MGKAGGGKFGFVLRLNASLPHKQWGRTTRSAEGIREVMFVSLDEPQPRFAHALPRRHEQLFRGPCHSKGRTTPLNGRPRTRAESPRTFKLSGSEVQIRARPEPAPHRVGSTRF